MSRPARPRWLWRILLLLPAAACWAGLFPPERELLGAQIAHRLGVQFAFGFVIIGPIPELEQLQPGHSGEVVGGVLIFRHPSAEGEPSQSGEEERELDRTIFIFRCLEARRGGLIASNLGGYFFMARWLIALVLSLLALPLLNAIRLRWRQSWRQRHERCVACGYSLHGLPAPRCPECGQPFGVVV